MGSLPPAQLAGLALPRLFGPGLAQGSYLGAWTFEETYSYIGILPLLFAAAALFKPRRWHAAFFFWVGAASLLLSLGDRGLLWPVLRLVPGFSVAENLVIKAFGAPPYTRRGILRWREIDQQARACIQEYDIRTPNPMVLVRHLSGGNQQKVVVARELSAKPALLVASQPTRGLDVASVEAVHNVLLQERNREPRYCSFQQSCQR